jgi:hypothetical protein
MHCDVLPAEGDEGDEPDAEVLDYLYGKNTQHRPPLPPNLITAAQRKSKSRSANSLTSERSSHHPRLSVASTGTVGIGIVGGVGLGKATRNSVAGDDAASPTGTTKNGGVQLPTDTFGFNIQPRAGGGDRRRPHK